MPDGFGKRGRRTDQSREENEENPVFDIYPNPARHELTVRFTLEDDAPARVSLHDISGRFITDLCEQRIYEAGMHGETRSVDNLRPGYYHAILHVHEKVYRRLIRIAP